MPATLDKPRRAGSTAGPEPRTVWVDAGLRLAQREGRKEYAAADVAQEAGLPASGLRKTFGSFDNYSLAVLQSFFDDLRDRVVLATNDEPPGRHRARLGVTAYLDRCLERASLRRWFFGRRQPNPNVAAALRRQNRVYFVILGGEFKDIGWAHPLIAARLFIDMVLDVSSAECAAGQVLPAFRDTLWTYLDAG